MIRPFKSTFATGLVAIAAASLNACSSGAGIGSPVPSGSTAASVTKAAVSFKIVLAAAPASPGLNPASVRPLYLSPNTASLKIAVTDPSSAVTNLTFDVTGTSAGCATSSGVITCVETGSIPVGPDSFAVTAFSGAGETGSQLSTATLAQTIVPGTANTVNLTLDGIVSSLRVAFAGGVSSVNGNHGSKTIGLSVSPLDASGALIFGSAAFTQPVALAADATSAQHVTFSKATLASPADASGLNFVYDGTYPLSQIVVTASATGATSASATLAVNAPPLPALSPTALTFVATGSSYARTLTVSESDYSGSWTPSSNCANVAAVTTTISPALFNVRPNAAGTCSITIADSYGNASSVPVSVTVTSFTVNSVGRHT